MTTKNYDDAIAAFNDCTKKLIGKEYVHKINKFGFSCRQIHMYYTFDKDYIICVSEFNINPNVDYLSGILVDGSIPTIGIVPLNKFIEDYIPVSLKQV